MLYFINSLKSISILFSGVLLFVSVITFFPLIGSLTLDNFPIRQVLSDNFSLLLPLGLVSIITGFVLGFATTRIAKRRILSLMIIGISASWLCIIAVMLSWSGLQSLSNDPENFILLSIWAVFAYGLFSFPILIPAILIIEKWTRRPNDLVG